MMAGGMDGEEGRLGDELALLEAMYPGQIEYVGKSREVVFWGDASGADGAAGEVDKGGGKAGRAKLVLRLPQGYPQEEGAGPEVVSARGIGGEDLRGRIKTVLRQVGAEVGGEGELLDEVLRRFGDLVDEGIDLADAVEGVEHVVSRDAADEAKSKTVVIWLHHLLATSKRKLAINPSGSQGNLRGVTKPGYPGVMVFAGERSAVEEHVAELKGLNWQAFAVRYEADELWAFSTEDITEVETMAEVVQSIEEGRREEFLKAVGVK